MWFPKIKRPAEQRGCSLADSALNTICEAAAMETDEGCEDARGRDAGLFFICFLHRNLDSLTATMRQEML